MSSISKIQKGQFPLDISSLIERVPHKPAYLNEIPFDIKDWILAFINEPKHLLRMALVSKDWESLIIPNHLQYRILDARLDRGYLWDHLSVRADLAKNIHTVRLMAPTDHQRERYPVTLCPPPEDFEELELSKIASAFRNFKSLRSLTWMTNMSFRTLPNLVFGSLLQCHCLEELRLGQIAAQLENSDVESLWKLSNIKRLVLRGTIWARCLGTMEDAFAGFLNKLPELEEITISYNPISPVFTSCALPKLKKLHLWPEYNVALLGQNILSPDSDMLQFLESHPTIEDLRWYPIDQGLPLPQGLLPSLKRILTTDRIAKTLLHDGSIVPERRMELISQISLGPNTIRLLQGMNGAYLQELHLWRFEDLEQIEGLGKLFPNIQTIDIPNFGRTGRYSADELIDTLACFLHLERFLDSSLWLAISLMPSKDGIQKLVNRLAASCPRLQTLRHWKRVNNLSWNVILKRRPVNEIWMYGDDVNWVEQEEFEED
ncbi:hypothetical protein BDN70DRAFT_992540 [Pholiota conissans]|uniref:F-box domain-containing protein n=1 Tax=Pholiota conissans TaxID=109636 RepID=A0A9P5Z4R4_9AGAR|nr:hypothetical protein BDN70DRAFT_992540 [Pholiota conissans]